MTSTRLLEAITGVLAPLNDPAYFIEVTVDPEAGTLGLTALACTRALYEQAKARPLICFRSANSRKNKPGRAGLAAGSEERPGWMQEDVQVALVEGSEDIGGSESRYRASGGARPGGLVRVNICAGQVAALGAKLALSRARASGSGLASSVAWWRSAVMYEVYLRSFADGDGDGIGDIPGLRSRLPYLRDLGVDGILITPWYPSPMKDGGYDVSGCTGIDPLFGTLADARELIDDAHRNDLKVVVDFVANHTSDQHPWFKRALAAAPGSGRARYHFRDGKGPGGSDPPNDWISAFGGCAWTRITEPDGIPGQWYLHLFSPAQPDLNWDNLEVRSDFESILRFWFDFGLDGLRIDAASGFAKDPALPDFGFAAGDIFQPVKWTGSPLWDVEGVHDILRSWRAIADSYDGERMFVGEVVVNGPQRLARYMRPGELLTTFNLDFLKSPWIPGSCTRSSTAPPPHSVKSARRPPGCSPAMTKPATLPATAGRPPESRSRRPIRSRPATGPWVPAVPAPCCCSCWHCPDWRSSTKARNSGSGKSRTSPTATSTTPSGKARDTPFAAATAAGSRCRGPEPSPRSALPPQTGSHGCPSLHSGANSRPKQKSAARTRC